jgi:acetyl-CoA carboxylase carboxyl transferase subunit beta
MNWLTNFIRPRIRQLVEPKEVPDNLWQKCPGCEGMLFHRDLEESHNVCYHCGHHLRLPVKQRLAIIFDDGKYEKFPLPKVAFDPLKFKDRKRYADRLKESRAKTGLEDAMTIAKGTIGGHPAVIAAFNFSFMGGSMGAGVGQAIVEAARLAVKTKSAFFVIPASGGARMQEGMLSLLQMPRTIIGVEMVKEAGLPYIVLLTDPTTGGVSASFAMVGDIHIAEPGATIGFAGRRVIEETVREKLPEDFQTAEYLQEHGMVDMVVPRSEIHETLSRILSLLMDTRSGGNKQKSGPFKSGPFKSNAAKANGQYNPGGERPSSKAVRAARALKQVKAAKRSLAKVEKSQETPEEHLKKKAGA